MAVNHDIDMILFKNTEVCFGLHRVGRAEQNILEISGQH